jgi:hypothetical protein
MTATFAVAGVVLVRALAAIAIEAWAAVKLGVGNDPEKRRRIHGGTDPQ